MAASKSRNHQTPEPAVNQSNSHSGRKRKGKKDLQKLTMMEQADRMMASRLPFILYLSLFLTIVFGILLFDVKVSTGGDDSSYIEMADNFMNGISFPTFHGPLYSMFLSIPMLLFGMNVVWLKICSFVFILAHLTLFYHTFRKLFSPALFSIILLIVALNSNILYFASQTYSEAMFMFLQALIILLFVQLFLHLESADTPSIKDQLKHWIMLGFFALAISLTREIGIAMLLAMVLFLIIRHQYLSGIMLTAGYFIFLIPYKIYKSIVWNSEASSRSSNLSELFLVNHYNPAEGYENVSGMVVRFFENARLYLSKHFMVVIGLQEQGSIETSWFVLLMVVALFIVAFYYAANINRTMLFIAIYLGASLAATFIALQTSWDQIRMVIIYVPMLLVFLSWGILQLSKQKGYRWIQLILIGLLLLVFFRTLGRTVDRAKDNQEVLSENLDGNIYFGYTPDWQNFLMMSEWVADNLPDSAMVASRKPSMSFIYSKGKDFYGIYRLPVESPDMMVREADSLCPEDVVSFSNAMLQNAPEPLQVFVKSNLKGLIIDGENLYGLYCNDVPFQNQLEQLAGYVMINPTPADSLVSMVALSPATTYAISPERLLQEFSENNVSYVIMASLRADPNMNTGVTINTVQRYLYFIEQKYPGTFSLVHQIGENDNEPARLFRVNYERYGF